VVAVTGANGSGKTTLLKILAGLLAPGRGAVEWNEGGGSPADARARARLAMVSPELALYEDLTARENFAFLRNRARPRLAGFRCRRRLAGSDWPDAETKRLARFRAG